MHRLLLATAILTAATAFAGEPATATAFDPATVSGTAGFFRVGQATDGTWWLIEPDGKPFFSRGVTSVNRSGRTGGRLALPGVYTDTVKKIHGDDPAVFVKATITRLEGWGFNTLGAWVTEDFFDQGMPYTDIVEFAKLPNFSLSEFDIKLPDVFDPAWVAAIDVHAAKLCAPRRDSRQLIGWFTDNELGFPGANEDEDDEAPAAGAKPKPLPVDGFLREAPRLLQRSLLLPEGRPMQREAWAFLLARHGNLPGIAKAWGVPLPDQKAPRGWTYERKVTETDANGAKTTMMKQVPLALATPGYLADQEAWAGIVAERYFRLCAQAIRKYDPNHLILGCRFGGIPSKAVLEHCKRPHVDVLSANNYWTKIASVMEEYWTTAKMPILIGEFSWSARRFVKVPTPPKQLDPAVIPGVQRLGQRSLESAIAHRAVVGYTWYRWVDSAGPVSPFGFGLVRVSDEPNLIHTEVLTAINARADDVHAQRTPPYQIPTK